MSYSHAMAKENFKLHRTLQNILSCLFILPSYCVGITAVEVAIITR